MLNLIKKSAVALAMTVLLVPQLSQAQLTEITNANAESLLKQSKTPVLFLFYADFCGYCKELEAVLVKRQPELSGKILLAKSDVVANQIGLPAVPVLILFDGGVAIDTVVGMNLEEMERLIVFASKRGSVPLRPSPKAKEARN